MIALWLTALVLLTLVMALAWATQRQVGNAGWVDVFWTFATGTGGVVCALWPLGGVMPGGRQWFVAAMVAAWSVRLGSYIALRVARSPREDVRYARFRKEWGGDFQRRMFSFVIVQGPIAAVLAGAVMLAARAGAPFPGIADVCGLVVLLAGAGIEGLADSQMHRFRREGQGKICDRGLWALSRHPNYVGEWLLWWAYPVIALGAGGGWVAGLSLAAPALMYWLLVHVSGVPPLEREMLASRGDAFRAYQARVPAFLPGFGK